MTRKKIKLVWIVNDAARKASLKKRRTGLLKKVSELTILCGVSALAIIYSPDEAEPMVWPSRPVVQQMLIRFQNMPEIERCKKMVNQESYLKERMGKAHEHSRKSQKKNREIELSYLMDRLHNHGNGIDDFEISNMQILIWLLEERMRDIRKRVEYFQQAPPLLPPGHDLVFLPPPLQESHNMKEMGQLVEVGSSSGTGGDHLSRNNNPTDVMPWDQWFLDMINNNQNSAAAAGSSGTKNDMAMAIDVGMGNLPPHACNFAPGYPCGTGVDMGPLDLGLPLPFPHGNFTMVGIGSGSGDRGGNACLDMGIPPPMGGNTLGFGPPHGNIAGDSNVAENTMGLGLPPPSNITGGSSASDEIGLQGFFADGTDMVLSFDGSKNWPHN